MAGQILDIFLEYIYAPILHREMLWILAPVAIAIILMNLYFRAYPRESIGHHKSLENAVFVVFILFDLTRQVLFQDFVIKKYLVAVFAVFSLYVSYLDFKHRLPTRLIGRTSSKFLVAYLSYAAVVLVYSDLLNAPTILEGAMVAVSVFTVLLLLILFAKVFHTLEPKSYEEIEKFLKSVEEDIEKTTKEIDQPELAEEPPTPQPR